MCDVMESDLGSGDRTDLKHSEVEHLQHQLTALEIRNRELEELLEKLRDENSQLLLKISSGEGLNNSNCGGAAPPPPPPPPPPPGLLAPLSTRIIKQKRTGPNKLNGEKKKDEATSKQSQLIMEVVNFLKSGGLNKSKRQRSMTQPDLSEDLAKFKEKRAMEAKEIAVDKFKSLRKKSDKATSLAKELDSLKDSGHNHLLAGDSLPANPGDLERSSTLKCNHDTHVEYRKGVGFTGQPLFNQKLRKSGSISDLRSKLGDEPRVSSKPATPVDSCTASPKPLRKDSVQYKNMISNEDRTLKSNEVVDTNTEEQVVQVSFDNDRSSAEISAEMNLRTHSRSSGIASSLLSERLSDLSFNSEPDPHLMNNEGTFRTSSISPRIVITPVDDPSENPMEVAFRKMINNDPAEVDEQHEGHKQNRLQPELAASSTKVTQGSVTVNGMNLRPPTVVQMQKSIQPQSTRSKQKFWEEAVASKPRSRTKSTAPSDSRSPSLERFANAARTTIKNNNQMKFNSGRPVRCEPQRQSPSLLQTNSLKANQISMTSLVPTTLNSTKASTAGTSRRAVANMNKFRT